MSIAMSSPVKKLLEAMRTSLLWGPANTRSDQRRAAASQALHPPGTPVDSVGLSEVVQSYLQKVSHAAYQITDDDMDALRREGLGDAEIYELTTAAAFEAGATRYELGMKALRGGQS